MSTSCQKQTSKKYASRPGPPYSANTSGCRGSRKRGNDGKMYKSVPNARGVYQWKEDKANSTSTSRKQPTSRSSSSRSSSPRSKMAPSGRTRKTDRAASLAPIFKSLRDLYGALAEGEAAILVYRDGNRKTITSKFKTAQARRKAVSKAIDEAQVDSNVRAILSSCMSYDCYERLEKKARDKSVEEVLDNWQKYWVFTVDRKIRSI